MLWLCSFWLLSHLWYHFWHPIGYFDFSSLCFIELDTWPDSFVGWRGLHLASCGWPCFMVRWLLQSSSQGPWCGRPQFLASPGLGLGIGPGTLSSGLLGVDGCTQWGCAFGFLLPCCSVCIEGALHIGSCGWLLPWSSVSLLWLLRRIVFCWVCSCITVSWFLFVVSCLASVSFFTFLVLRFASLSRIALGLSGPVFSLAFLCSCLGVLPWGYIGSLFLVFPFSRCCWFLLWVSSPGSHPCFPVYVLAWFFSCWPGIWSARTLFLLIC